MKQQKPLIGCSFRTKVKQTILDNIESFETLEIMVDHYLAAGQKSIKTFKEIAALKPIVLHSVALSLGTAAEIDKQYLNGVAKVIDELNALVYSEHLSFTKAGGIDTSLLLPLPRTDEAAELARD